MNAELRPPRRLKHLQRHQRHRRRGYNQGTLIAWLDEQERILRMRGVPTEVVQEFDPIHNLPEEQKFGSGLVDSWVSMFMNTSICLPTRMEINKMDIRKH